MKVLQRCVLVILAAALALGIGNKVMAEDELYLCGIVKDVDSRSGTVTVDVKSSGCRGIRTFKLSSSINIASFKVDEKRCFFIDSNICEANKTYGIMKD